MSELHEKAERFNSLISSLKNIAWLLGIVAGFAGIVFVLSKIDASLLIVAMFALVVATYAAVRAYIYRCRYKRIVAGFVYIHRLTHDIRNAFDKTTNPQSTQAGPTNNLDLSKKVSESEMISFELISHLRTILDNGAHCFREITGRNCHTSLIMPCYDEQNGEHLKSVLYCSDVDPERTKNTKPQRGGLSKVAFEANEPVLFDDYEKEMKKGNFVPNRADWKKWYRSGFMAHFKVSGERFGVFSVDCPRPSTFRENESQLIAAFADACGLIFNLCDETVASQIYEKSKILDKSTDTEYFSTLSRPVKAP